MESKNPYPFRLFGRPDGVIEPLLKEVASKLSTTLGKSVYKDFSNGEYLAHHNESIRDCDVYLFMQPNFGDKFKLSFDLDLLETMVLSLNQGTPNRITVIIPCLPYARQDRPSNYREPVLVQKIPMRLQVAGADRIVTLRLHNPSSYNAHTSTIRIENIDTKNLMVKHIKSKDFDLSKFKIVSPDLGAAPECRRIAEKLGIPNGIVIINKYHDPKKTNDVEVMEVIGDPEGYHCIMFDDMIDTCGTAKKSFFALKNRGAKNIYFSAVHGILSGKAIENLEEAGFTEIWLTDTCDFTGKKELIKKLEIVPAAKLIARVISNLHNGESITDLSKNGE